MRDEQLEKIISDIVTPCAWSTPSDLQMAYIVARHVAQAYKAKLAAQEPVVYRFLHPSTKQYVYITDNVPKIKEFEPLYAHPMPNQARIKEALRFAAQVIELYDDATLVSDNYMLTSTDCAEIIKELVDYIPCVSTAIDKTACVSENGKSETQAAHSPTKGMNLAERAAFEAAMDGLLFDRADDGTYTSSVTRVALEAYQAGRADLQSPEIQALRKDAGRYRWLRDPKNDVALVLDKCTGYVPENEQMPGVGGYRTYEYRAGVELDSAIDATRGQCQASSQVNLDSSESCEENLGLELARNQPCGCVVCYCENQVQCLGCGAEHCGTHDLGEIPNPVYVDHIPDASKMVGLSLSVDAKETQALLQSYLDGLDGWQLMPKKLTDEMHRSAVNFIENAPDCMWIEYISSLYNTLLATAPKPTEVDK